MATDQRLDAAGFAALCRRRQSVRAFLNEPVSDVVLQDILRTARQAPSGANLQPGSFYWVRGEVRHKLSAAVLKAYEAGEQEQDDYPYFPRPMPSVLRRRQVAAARALYGALGIEREDRAARDAQFARNFTFFGAPVALVVTLRSDFGSGAYMDLGMSLYGLMLAAQSHGLASCAIGALSSYPSLVRQHLGLDTQSTVVCGMALGYADTQAAVNRTQTERCELDEYFQILG